MERIRDHHRLDYAKRGNTHKDRWAAKLIRHGRLPAPILLKECASNEEALAEEVRLIAYFRGLGFDLVNLTDGGEGAAGFKMPKDVVERAADRKRREWMEATPEKREELLAQVHRNLHTPEVRAKMSEALTGRTMSKTEKLLASFERRRGVPMPKTPKMIARGEAQRGIKRGPIDEETRQKMADAWTPEKRKARSERYRGRTLSEETRKKMSEARKGRVVSEETRKKIAEAQKGVPRNYARETVFSEEECAKRRERQLGHVVSAETRQKIRAAITGTKWSAARRAAHEKKYLVNAEENNGDI